MLLIFSHGVTAAEKETCHSTPTPPSMVHLAFEIELDGYEEARDLLEKNNINRKGNCMENGYKIQIDLFSRFFWQSCRIHNKKLLASNGLIFKMCRMNFVCLK
jgi:hypothetical protein